MAQRPKNNALAKFLYTISEKHMNLALKTYWIFSGYEKDCLALKEHNGWITGVREQVEARMQNGDKRALLSAMSTADPSLILSEKVWHFDYVSLQNEFVDKLIRNTLKLKEIDPHSRLPSLNKFLEGMNQWIEEKVRGKSVGMSAKYKRYYRGVMIPLEVGADEDPILIVNIAVELGHCYNTRKRAPYKIAFETIKLHEADSWEEKILAKSKEETATFREELKEEASDKARKFPKKRQTLDDLFGYKLEFKGFEKFARLMKAEEQKLRMRAHSRTFFKAPQLSARVRCVESPKRRVHSAEKSNKYLSDQFFSRMSSMKAVDWRTRGDMNLETVIEKYGRKNSLTPKNADSAYIPLEDRLEGIPDPFGQSWEATIERTKKKSNYRKFESYSVKAYIVKGNDDLRQELMAIQFMRRLQEIYCRAGMQIFLYPYDILSTSNDSGVLGKRR